MQIILSRKGFDSKYGRIASPILPDGTLLSLPIPSNKDAIKYSDLNYNKRTYYDIIKGLNPRTKITENYNCHLDPDIRKEIANRGKNWKPLFGQSKTALSHLLKQNVKSGDIFLFFGWFKNTELIDKDFKYVKNTPDLHVIYGYFQINEMHLNPLTFPKEFCHHPHANISKYPDNNCIIEATNKLSIMPDYPGSGVFKYNPKLILSKEDETRSKWKLPSIFRKVNITYHSKESWKANYFQSADIGQEFVIKANDNIIEWTKEIIKSGLN